MGAYLSFGAALAAAGVTSSLPVSYNTLHTVAVTVATIGTNVVVRVEGSNDDSNYFNLSAAGTDTTITANGTYGFQYSGVVEYIRVRLVSISTGSPKVTATYAGR